MNLTGFCVFPAVSAVGPLRLAGSLSGWARPCREPARPAARDDDDLERDCKKAHHGRVDARIQLPGAKAKSEGKAGKVSIVMTPVRINTCGTSSIRLQVAAKSSDFHHAPI